MMLRQMMIIAFMMYSHSFVGHIYGAGHMGRVCNPLGALKTQVHAPYWRHFEKIKNMAAIAQLGECQTEDLKVPGSIPGLGK